MSVDKLRIVLDTNILVSAIIARSSTPARATHFVFNSATLLLSDELLSELIKVLFRRKFRKYFPESFASQYIHLIQNISESVEIEERVNVCRDPFDNHLLELSASGDADYLITGDDDLLVLKSFRNTVICDATTFLANVQ